MNTIYLNMQGPNGRETVDQFTRGVDSPSDLKEFRKYVRQMADEYRLAGMDVYMSSRACKAWLEA